MCEGGDYIKVRPRKCEKQGEGNEREKSAKENQSRTWMDNELKWVVAL